MKTINYIISFLIVGILLTISGCSDDLDKMAIPPTSEDAIFNISYDSENPNKVYFVAEPAVATWYTHWSFGDNTSYDKGLETSKVFLKKGEYNVEFKIFSEGGSASSIQTVIIDSDFAGPNILRNGDFSSGDEFWTILPISNGVDVTLENENAHWTGGSWGQVGIYQPVHVLANNLYQITMDIKGSGLSDSWFEVYIGTEPPVIGGPDYSDGGMRLALNTWDGCGSEPFDGPFSDYSCVGSGATFEFSTEGTAYFVIRGGGASYGDTGVTVDNIAIRSLESTDPPIYPTLGSPAADFTFEISDLAATFTNTSTNATSYVWDFGDNSGTSTEANPSYTYTQDGTYTVMLTASIGDESSEITKEVTVTEPVPVLVADFTFETTELVATFTNTSANATTYAWDFGDNAGVSTDENPSYTYTEAGTYSVKLTAINSTESVEVTKEVTVSNTAPVNLISNGTFDDNTGWTIVNQYEAANTNGLVTIADGVAKFDETTNTDWKHMGIYTAVSLSPGTYQFEMDMTYTEISDVWGEVFIGAQQPVEGVETGIEYSGDQKVLKAFNAWDCGDIKTYSGKATESGCDDANPTNPGQFEITTAGTYYLLFRAGGGTYGTAGIVIDNVSLVKTN